jgi:NADPH:quinone reductase-like Zn-dependent oxidoreductase
VIDESSEHQQQVSKLLQENLQNLTHQNCDIYTLDKIESPDGSSELAYIFLAELEHPLLEDISSEAFLALKQILISAKGILWLTGRDKNLDLPPSRGIIDGLVRVVRAENNHSVIVTVSLENGSGAEQVDHITKLVEKTDFSSTDQSYESAYLQSGGNLNICRIIAAKETSRDVYQRSLPEQSKTQAFETGPPLLLTVTTPGLLDSLEWVEDTSYAEPLAPDEVEVKVHMVGLNFRDLLLALGRINGTTLGTECAGVVSRAGKATDFEPGDRVALFTPTAFATYTRIKAVAVARVPDGVSLMQAASVPSQFVAAWDALQGLGKLQKGETILIHSGAGGTGQAAIQIAQYLGSEIFTTVGSGEKKKFLMEHYHIPADHIFYSRDTAFADGIRRMTNGRGVDMVLNSLAGESLVATWDLIAPYGRFIEIGKKDIDANSSLPMRPFMRGATFASLDVSSKFYDVPWLVKSNIEKLLDMFRDGIFQPAQPVHVLPISDVQKGMRMLQEGKMIGKIVFEMNSEALIPVSGTGCFTCLQLPDNSIDQVENKAKLLS